jgi:hypothetical protein
MGTYISKIVPTWIERAGILIWQGFRASIPEKRQFREVVKAVKFFYRYL